MNQTVQPLLLKLQTSKIQTLEQKFEGFLSEKTSYCRKTQTETV